MYCNHCGNEVFENTDVCPNCGNPCGNTEKQGSISSSQGKILVSSILVVLLAICIAGTVIILKPKRTFEPMAPEGETTGVELIDRFQRNGSTLAQESITEAEEQTDAEEQTEDDVFGSMEVTDQPDLRTL